MSTNNKVFQVLVTKGNQAVLPAGSSVEDLAPNQIGVFNMDTKESIDGTDPVKNFFVAVGVDKDGDGVTDSINMSAGQVIQKENVRDYTYKPYTAPVNQKFLIKDFTNIQCDTDYAVKFEFRNLQIYMRQGTVQFSKTYAVRTACCEGCEDCPSGSCVDLTQKLMDAFNFDESKMFSAKAVLGGSALTVTTGSSTAANATVNIGGVVVSVALGASDSATVVGTKIATAITSATTTSATATSTTGVVTVTNIPAGTAVTFDAGTTGAVATVESANTEITDFTTLPEGVCPAIEIEANGLAINKFCNINTKYYNPRQTVIVASLVEGFNCTGAIEITQQAVAEEGNGNDIKQKEYHAGGWNGRPGPYKASSVYGLALDGYEYYAEEGVLYDQVMLVYDQFSTAGWGEYLNNLWTIFAIPTADNVTRDSFLEVIDTILAGHGLGPLEP